MTTNRSFFYGQSFKVSPAGIACAGMDGQFMIVNPALCRLLGYGEDELLTTNYFMVIHPEDGASLRLRVKHLQEYSLSTYSLEVRISHKSGYWIWTSHQLSLIFNEPDRRPLLHIHIVDITGQKQTGQALISSQKSLAEIQKIGSIGSWDWDIRNDETVWTEQLFRIVDIHPSQSPGKRNNLIHFLHPDDRELYQSKLDLALAGDIYELECRIITASNRIKHIHIQGFGVFDEQGRPVKLHGTVQDISERKQTQELLVEAYERYTSLKNYNPDAIISVDRNGFISSANPAAKEVSGYSTDELTGMHFSSLLHRDDVSYVVEQFNLLMLGGKPEKRDIRMLHKDGSIIDLSLTAAPIVIQRQIAGCYVMIKDVTDQKQKDEMLRKSEKLSVVGQLAAGVAHEIRNPLTALKGFIQLMMHSEQQFPKYLDIMKEELERIELIVSELLVLSKPQSLQLKLMNMKELVEEVRTLISTQAIMNNTEILFSAAQDDYPVYCDPNQIKQVIINFLKNAIEAMKHGGLIRIELVHASSGFTVLTIEDQGCGIPEEHLLRLGEAFFTTKEGGTGLGLMISQKIIEQHGGKLFVKSTLNVGTTVEVRFPLPSQETGISM